LSTVYFNTFFSAVKKCVSIMLTLLVGGAVFVTGCNGDHHAAAVATFGSTGAKVLTVQGSDTMEKMVRAWSLAFMKVHPDVRVVVQSGDTGTGIKGLIDHKISLAAGSRELTADEDTSAHAKAVHLTRTMVAKDAVAVIVGPNNPITLLTMDELKGIFVGDITKWAQIKSSPAAQVESSIIVLGREASSGTGDFLREHVLGGKPFAAGVKLMPSSESVIDAVEKQNQAIGFVGMSQAEQAGKKVKVVTIKLNSASLNQPREDSLTGSDYPLSRPLYLYFDAAGDGLTQSFVEYCKSSDGQAIVKEMGFITLH
jgi:phosphate transport system substrate-binding protein